MSARSGLRLALALFAVAGPAAGATFPELTVARGDHALEWPFAIERGTLTCIVYGRQKYVFFSEILTPEEQGSFGNMKLPRMVVVTANPMAYLASFEDRALYAAFHDLETLIRRLAPYEKIGWDLCDTGGQPLKSEP